MTDRHALTRTSPKGKGQPFIGTCIKCGIKGISLDEVSRSECVNPAGLNNAETLTLAIKGPSHD